ncbi:MetQ/NlpA family ABC transporter substrate-binding protein [Schinkia sp. CFF1]
MMKNFNKQVVLPLLALVLLLSILSACGSSGAENKAVSGEKAEDSKELKIGATVGPYSDMVSKAIKPILEQKGYKVEVVEFSDYIQPNIALGNGSLNANLYQHKIYMETFAKDNQLDLSEVLPVPTVPMGIYSNKYKTLDEVKEGSTVAIPNDPTNLARALLILQDVGLIKFDENANALTVSEKDIIENPKNLVFHPIEAAQLPRSLESTDLSAINGNFALAAGLRLQDALQLENIPADYLNLVVVNTKDLEAPFVKDIREAVESAQFEKVIDEQFQGYSKPDWMKKQ